MLFIICTLGEILDLVGYLFWAATVSFRCMHQETPGHQRSSPMGGPGKRRRGACSFFFLATTPKGPYQPGLGIVVGVSVGDDDFWSLSADPGVTGQSAGGAHQWLSASVA